MPGFWPARDHRSSAPHLYGTARRVSDRRMNAHSGRPRKSTFPHCRPRTVQNAAACMHERLGKAAAQRCRSPRMTANVMYRLRHPAGEAAMASQKFALDHMAIRLKASCTTGSNHRSAYIGGQPLLGSLPRVDWLLGDRGYDTRWFREASQDIGIRACSCGQKQRKTPVGYDRRRRNRRDRIKIMFGGLTSSRPFGPRHDRRPKVLLSVIALVAPHIYRLRILTPTRKTPI